MGRFSISYRFLQNLNNKGKTYRNYDMKSITTFGVGGKALFYLEVATIENLVKVLKYTKNKIPVYIIGNGSNILISDNGFDGVIIKLIGDFSLIEKLDDSSFECGAGVKLGSLISYTIQYGLSGLEDGVGIPATIGGAVCMNASAFNFEMAKVVSYVVAFVDDKIRYFTNKECGFSYRESIFQHNDSIILRVGINLERKDMDYSQRTKHIMDIRKSNQPLNCRSAGSVFKKIDGLEVSRMLDEIGIKGKTIGGASVSTKHANFIINENNAMANDIYLLMLDIQKQFEIVYGIKLIPEIKLIGDFDETNR